MSTAFIKIPNSIIGDLKGHDCIVYLYIIYLCTINCTDSVKVKQETIAQKMGITCKSSVNRTMQRLQKSGYISMKNNYNRTTHWQTCNTVTLNNFDPQSDYFLLPSEYIFFGMPSAAVELMLTLYMYSFNDPHCFPSFTQISAIAKLSSASISKGIKILEEKGIIKKENYFKKDGSKGHNRYFIIKKIERIIGTEKTEKFIAWIEKQKGVCFLLWQLIKEVLMGNSAVLDEICVQFENTVGFAENKSVVFTDKFTPDNCCPKISSPIILQSEHIQEKVNKKKSAVSRAFEFVKEKASRIRNGIRHIFLSVSKTVKQVLS